MELYKQHLLIKLIRMPIQHRIKRYYLKEIELWHAKMSKQLQEHYNNLLQEIYNKYKLEPSAETQEEQQQPSAETQEEQQQPSAETQEEQQQPSAETQEEQQPSAETQEEQQPSAETQEEQQQPSAETQEEQQPSAETQEEQQQPSAETQEEQQPSAETQEEQQQPSAETQEEQQQPSAETQEEQQPPQQPSAVNINKKACLIGINYTNTSNELYGCVNDVMNLKTMLETKYKYNPENIRTIINEQATRNTILREFALLLKNATSGDILFFSYSGHGTYTIDRSGEEIDGKDELLVSVDNYAIFDDELKQIIDIYLKPNVKLFTLFDNCHSGTILDLPYQYFKTTTQSPIEPIIHPKCRETQGEVICLSGCRDDQVSMDAYINNAYAGAMTRTFIDVLTNVDMNNSLLGQGLSWNVFINEIRTMLRLRNFQQIPQLTCGNKIDFTVKPVVF
jgi:hypothetical protein